MPNNLHQPFALQSLVDTQAGSIVSHSITKNDSGNVTVFAFGKDEELSPHSAPYDALVCIQEGLAKITIDKEEHQLKTGQAIVMPANIPHAVYALEDMKMLLVMIKGKA